MIISYGRLCFRLSGAVIPRPAKPLHDRGAKLKSKKREKIGLPGSFLKGSFAEVKMASMPFLLVLY